MATTLRDLIESINADDLPTNEFTIEDKDPMVILGKLNEVIDYLETLNSTINSSDSKANEALQKAIQAVADATQALSVANGIDSKATQALANAIEAVSTANTALSASNTALSTANTAISTANTALSSANDAVETAGNALSTAESAEAKADTAITTANGAKTTAEGIDAKATTALANSQSAISTANTANDKATSADTKADTAITTANSADTKADTAITTANTANTNASNAVSTANSASSTASTASENASTALTTAQTADQNASTALTTANNADSKSDTAIETAQEALDQVVAGLGTKVYRDSQLLSTLDIKPIEDDIANNTTAITNLSNNKVDKVTGKQLSTEDFTTAEKNKLAGLNNYDDTQLQADITALQNADNVLSAQINGVIDKIYPIGSIYMSMNNTNPQTFLGGTWEQIKDCFMWATGDTTEMLVRKYIPSGAKYYFTAGSRGGEFYTSLAEQEMPSHTHTQNSHNHTQGYHMHFLLGGKTNTNAWSANVLSLKNSNNKSACVGAVEGTEDIKGGNYYQRSNRNNYDYVQQTQASNNATTATNQSTGGNVEHNNMPPYLSCYMWKRTA